MYIYINLYTLKMEKNEEVFFSPLHFHLFLTDE